MDNLKNFVVSKGLEVGDSINTEFITLNGKSVSGLVDSSNVLGLIDSAYIVSKSSGVDSAATSSLIDSAYVQARESVSISSFNTIAIAGQTDLVADSVGLSWKNSTEQAALINSDFSSTDAFARFVDLAGDYALISATAYDQTPYENNGAAFIFKRTDSAGGTGWAEQYKLYRALSTHSISLGWGVSLNDSATLALVSNGGSSPAITAFVRDSDASTTWTEGQRITPDGGVSLTSDWARDGSIEQKGNYFAVGAKQDYGNGSSSTRYGSAWVYNRDSSGGSWAVQQELIPSDDSDGASEKKFGKVLSMPTDSLIGVGAPNFRTGSLTYRGAVYIFERDGSTWTQTQKIAGPGGDGAYFGNELQIDGDYMAVSAHRESSGAGKVHIYKKIGGTWTQQTSIQASDATTTYFGSGLALRGSQLLVGSYAADTVYIFQRFFEEWREVGKIEGSSLSSGAGQLGGEIPGGIQINKDKTKNDFILGSRNNAAYVFKVPTAEGPSDTLTLAAGPGITLTTDPSTETVTVAAKDSLAVFSTLAIDGQPDVVTNSKTIVDYASTSNQQVIIPPNGTADDYFGEGVAIDNGYAIVNAKWSDSDVTNAGACYIYVRSGTTWSLQQTITSPINNPTTNNFGSGVVDIKGSRVVIGAEDDDSNGTNAGAIYTFTRSGTTWTEEQRIVSSDIAAGDKFGSSVSMQGNYIAVGAYAKDDSAGGDLKGSAYIFKAITTTTLENAAFDNVQSLSLSSSGNTNLSNPDTMLFNSDGTKVYIYDRTKDIIAQYSLAAPYDIVSNFRTLWAGKPGNAEYSVSIADQSNMVIKGMRWNNDGTKIFVICNTNDKIYQHNLTTAYDISTASYSNKSFSTSAQETQPYGFTFNNDGTSMYICGVQEKKVFQYTLSTAYDLSTVSYANRSYAFNHSSLGNPGALQFDETGKKLFILHTGGGNGVRQHNLATAFDVGSSITVSHSLNIYTQGSYAMDFTFNADMSKLYAVDDNTNKIYQYSTSGAGAEWVQQAILTPDDVGAAGDQFGWDIELNEDASTVIVSANEHNTHENPIVTTGAGYGNTYVFTRSGSTWSQQAMLQPAGLISSQRSGNAASISKSGNYIGICVQGQDTPDGYVGTVYVFKKIGSAWVEQAKLYPTDANSDTRFSASIVMGDDFLAVGDYGASVPGSGNAGAVYFWKRSGETWTQINKIYAFDTNFGSLGGLQFGNVNSLAIDGNDILVGAYKAPAHTGPGRAYVFTATNTETLADTLTLAGGSGITLTNTSSTDTVTIASDITSINTDLTSTDSDQVIHSFSKTDFRSVKYLAQLTTPVTPAGITWDSAIDTAAIQHSGAANNDYFGVDVGIDGNYAIVGAYGDDEAVGQGGAAYVFFNDKGNGGWSQQALIGGDTNQDYYAGLAVAIGGSTKGSRVALGIPKYNLGNNYGRVMFYTRSGTTWTHQASINGALGATTAAAFGSSLAMSGDTTVVGAPAETSNTGRAYVYSGNGVLEQNIISSDAATGDKFGFSIDIDGDLMAVTAPNENGQTGACYVFEKSATGTAGPLSNAVFVHKSPLTYQAGMTGDANANMPSTLVFKPDGTKAYIADANSDLIYQYSLSTPYDVRDASMSYDSVSFNLRTSMGTTMTPGSMKFKPDGTKLYVLKNDTDTVYEYDLSTAYDLSTISYNSKNLSISSVEGFPQGIFFKPDGTKMYVTGTQYDSVRMLDLSTAWDVSSGTYNSSNTFSMSSQDTEPMEVIFNSSGTKMYMLGGANRAIYSYTLSTAWDVTTASYDSQFYSIASGTDVNQSQAKTIALSADANANKLFVVGTNRDEICRIDMGVDYWVQKAKLVHTGAQGSDRFGYSVSCHKGDNGINTIAVGHNDQRSAPTPPQGGGVFVFTGSGTSYTQQAKIVPTDVATGDLFGSSDVNGRGISNQIQFNKGQAQGDTLFIGSMHDDDNSLSNSGSVYVFTRSGGTWSQAYKKTAFTKGPSASAAFGASLDVDENGSLIVGAPIDDEGGTGRGTTYIFDPKQVSASTAKKVHSEELLLTHDETNVAITGYGKLVLDSDLGEFDAAINGSNVELRLTPTKTNINVKLKTLSTIL